jgi:hydroxyacylglutathione hydrolase
MTMSEPGKLVELAKGIQFIPAINNGRYPYSHSLLIEDELTALIDPAAEKDFFDSIAATKKVDVIILSHYHEDHFWFSYLFPEAEIWMPELDAPALENLDALLDAYRLKGEWREDWRKMMREQFHYHERNKSRLLKEGDSISFGNIEMKVLHTPGHTQGHSCFHFPGQGVLFLADIDLTKFGPWYGDLGSDIDDFIASIKRVAGIECPTYLVSHEGPLFHGEIRKEAESYARVIDEREEKLRELLKAPRTMDEIVNARIVYRKPREPKSFFDFGEWALMTKHLDRMIKRGDVVQVGNRYALINS